jgi:hypothetical protein
MKKMKKKSLFFKKLKDIRNINKKYNIILLAIYNFKSILIDNIQYIYNIFIYLIISTT